MSSVEVGVSDEVATEEERRIAAEMDESPEPEAGVEAGERRTLADLAGETPDRDEEAEEAEPEQYTLFGTAPTVNGTVKGKVASSHVKFTAKQQQLPGQFQMGDTVELRVLARVDKVEFIAKHDGDGNEVERKRVHRLSALSVEQVGDAPDGMDPDLDGRG